MYESSSSVIRQMANLSYANESIIYHKAGFNKELNGIGFNDAKSLRNYLKNKDNFNSFQDALKILVYGENYIFVKYFYDKSFISQIAINTERWEKKVLSGTSGKAISHDEYQGFQKSIKESGHLDGENAKEQITDLQKKLKKAGNSLWKFIEKLGIINSEEIAVKIGEDYESVIADILSNYLLNASFTYGYDDKTGKKMQKITGDGTIIDILSKGLKGLSYYREVEGGKLKVKYPTATFLELTEIVNEKDGNIEFQVFADKNTITRVVTGAIGYLQDLNELKDNEGNTIVNFTEQSDNSIKMAFNANSNLKNLDVYNMTKEQAFDAATTILNVIKNLLQNYNDVVALQSFNTWRAGGVDSIFADLIFDDRHLLEEILNKRTMAHVSGTIGEVMFSLFLKILQSSQGIGEGVKVLGQTDFGTGSAAVDTKILTGDLRDIGFQIKNYTSIKNTISLYSQSNKLSAEKEMKRYIEDWAYEILQEIFFKYNTNGDSLFPNKNYAERIDEVENILEYHIPYYLRFDEASLEKQEQDLTQNNFYILNFSFIPASVIFIIIAEALEEKDKEKRDKFFFFSKGKREGELLPQPKNLLSSWEQTYKEIDGNDNGNNILEKLKDNVYLNFIGIRITFQKELEILFKNC